MSCSVLLCDDAMFTRMMLSGILQDAGYDVIGEAADGLAAVERYDELRPDLVIMDMVMPGMAGIDAVRAIRARHPGARIVMCSAVSQRELCDEALAAGAAGFIIKPFDARQVLEVLDASAP
jgi:two-component system chemotaxis response regulator CheY